MPENIYQLHGISKLFLFKIMLILFENFSEEHRKISPSKIFLFEKIYEKFRLLFIKKKVFIFYLEIPCKLLPREFFGKINLSRYVFCYSKMSPKNDNEINQYSSYYKIFQELSIIGNMKNY